MERTLYRIYTEDKNVWRIKHIVGSEFIAYTIIKSDGVWNGVSEKSIIIEIIASVVEYSTIKRIAEQIKLDNKQDAVLISRHNIDSELI